MRLFTTNSCGLVGSSTFRRRSSSRKISICAARLQSRRAADPTLTDNMIARGRGSVTLEPEPAAKRLAAVVVVAEPSVVPGTSAGDTRWRKNHQGKGAPGAQIKGEANPDHGHRDGAGDVRASAIDRGAVEVASIPSRGKDAGGSACLYPPRLCRGSRRDRGHLAGRPGDAQPRLGTSARSGRTRFWQLQAFDAQTACPSTSRSPEHRNISRQCRDDRAARRSVRDGFEEMADIPPAWADPARPRRVSAAAWTC